MKSMDALDLSLDDILDSEPTDGAAAPGLARPDAADAVTEPPRNPEWLRFEADLRRGLIAVKRQVMGIIAAGEQPKKISVAWVLREAGRGRSQFYAKHAAFEVRILRAQRAAERVVALRAKKAQRQPGKTELAKENRRLKVKIQELEAREISKLATIAFERAFPRDLVILNAENAALRAQVSRLEEELASLRSYLRTYDRHQGRSVTRVGRLHEVPLLGSDTPTEG